jgi:hypothetical protein
MRRSLAVVTLLSWGLWFGGMMALILFVTRLFQTSHDLAAGAAPVLFKSFAIYQLIVGAIACASATALTLLTRRSLHALLTLALIAALGIAIVLRSWTIEMMSLDRTDVQQVARFLQMHRGSTNLYSTAAILLLIGGVGWVVTLPSSTSRSPDRRAKGTASA